MDTVGLGAAVETAGPGENGQAQNQPERGGSMGPVASVGAFSNLEHA